LKQRRARKGFLHQLFWIFCSLKLAVLVILALTLSLAAGTIVESLYDTATSQYWIYRASWFHLILALLGVNIFCVAVSRYPWKIRHIPFLLAHLGILMLLAGSWMTEKLGIDGNLRVSEGETVSVVEMDTAYWVVSEKDQVKAVPLPWLPPTVDFKPMDAASYGIPFDLKVDRFITHADPVVTFIKNAHSEEERALGKKKASAIKLLMVGGPMGISEEIWLWEGSASWRSTQAGPARLALGQVDSPSIPGQPQLSLEFNREGGLTYLSQSSDGKKLRGSFPAQKAVGRKINPGWRGGVEITIQEIVPDAVIQTTYRPSRIQYGNQAPTSAIHIVASGGDADVWLGLGDRAILRVQDREVELGYYPKRVVLPFSIRLEQFTIEHDPGTLTPAAYASRVSVLGEKGQKDVLISMNEPLEMKGYSIYQASYEDGEPRPVTSIFSVNQDPGRTWKYLGSLLIVLGSVLLFAAKYRQTKKSQKGSLSLESVSEPLPEA
jgi:hypothetical protein